MPDQRNMILAIVLSIAILFGFQIFFPTTPPPPDRQVSQKETPQVPADAPEGDVSIPGESPAMATPSSRKEAFAATPHRVSIRTARLHGSISLVGGRLDDLILADYREEIAPESPQIVLLSPRSAEGAYFSEFGWVATGGMAVPRADSLWTADRDVLEPGRPVTLSWDNGQGLLFKLVYALDQNYMFTVTQMVENNATEAAALSPYGLISRHGTPEITSFIILHEGLLGVFDGTLQEVDYKDVREDGSIKNVTTGGWMGITDKYWLTALIPDQSKTVASRFFHFEDNGLDKYQADYLAAKMTVNPGETIEFESHFFAGAKEVNLLDGYAETLGVDRFDLAIDFGWLYFITKPIFIFLIIIHDYVGNLGVSILLLTVIIKLLFFPLANKSYVAMSKMKKLQPEMTKLRERFGEDKVRLNQEMMGLYKKEKVNPASGCLPILIQIPVFFALYKVLFVTIELRQAPFFGWIQDLSQRDPTTIFNLFGLIPWAPPEFLMIGAWPLIMGGSMYLQQKLNPQPADPLQAKIFMFLPILFTFMLAPFPAGLVVYWAWNNTLSIAQQWLIMKRMGVKV